MGGQVFSQLEDCAIIAPLTDPLYITVFIYQHAPNFI